MDRPFHRGSTLPSQLQSMGFKKVSRGVQCSDIDRSAIESVTKAIGGEKHVDTQMREVLSRTNKLLNHWEVTDENLQQLLRETVDVEGKFESINVEDRLEATWRTQGDRKRDDETKVTEDEERDIDEHDGQIRDIRDLHRVFRSFDLLVQHLDEAKGALGTRFSLASWQHNHQKVQRALEGIAKSSSKLKQTLTSLKSIIITLNNRLQHSTNNYAELCKAKHQSDQVIVDQHIEGLLCKQKMITSSVPFPSFQSLSVSNSLTDLELKYKRHLDLISRPAPMGQSCVVVHLELVDVDELWHKDSRNMKPYLLKIWDTIRGSLQMNSGYESISDGIHAVMAFSNAEQAVGFCMQVQIALLELPCPLPLAALVDSLEVDGKKMFNGLSVKMGIHMGPSWIERDLGTLKCAYFGRVPNISRFLCDCGKGGDVVVSEAVYSAVTKALRILKGGAVAHQVGSKEIPCMNIGTILLYKIFPIALNSRADMFLPSRTQIFGMAEREMQEFLLAERQIHRSVRRFERPPFGEVFIVASIVENSDYLWDWDPETMAKNMCMNNALIRRLAEQHNGYEAQYTRNSMINIFQHAQEAMLFALAVQERLLYIAWTETLLASPMFAKEVENSKVIWKGLRNGMAIHSGLVEIIHEPNQRAEYYGEAVEKTKSMLTAVNGGEVLLSEVAYNAVKKNLGQCGEPIIIQREDRVLPLSYGPGRLFSMVSKKLHTRCWKDNEDDSVHVWWWQLYVDTIAKLRKLDDDEWDESKHLKVEKIKRKFESSVNIPRIWMDSLDAFMQLLPLSKEDTIPVLEKYVTKFDKDEEFGFEKEYITYSILFLLNKGPDAIELLDLLKQYQSPEFDIAKFDSSDPYEPNTSRPRVAFDFSVDAMVNFIHSSSTNFKDVTTCKAYIAELSLEFYKLHSLLRGFVHLQTSNMTGISSLKNENEFALIWVKLQRSLIGGVGGHAYKDKQYLLEFNKQLQCIIENDSSFDKRDWRKYSKSFLGLMNKLYLNTYGYIKRITEKKSIREANSKRLSFIPSLSKTSVIHTPESPSMNAKKGRRPTGIIIASAAADNKLEMYDLSPGAGDTSWMYFPDSPRRVSPK